MMTDLTFPLARSAQMVAEDPEAAREAFHEVAESASPMCPSCKRRIKHREGLEWCRDRQMSERTLQDRVVDRAKRRHWKVAHAGKGWVGDQETGAGQFITPMAPGWPDLMLFNPEMVLHKVIAMELKRETGEVSADQWEWISLLNRCGIPTVVIRPSDLRRGAVNAILEGR
jgi:hypothetical protein